MSSHKILIIKGMGLGDIILGVPLLRNLRKCFSESKIYLLNHTGPGREILKNCPYIDEIISLDDAYKGVGYKIRFLSMLRKKKFDLVIDSFPTTNNTALLCSLINAKKTIGFDNNKFSLLYNVRIPFDRRKNIVEIEKGIVDYLIEDSEYDKRLELFINTKDEEFSYVFDKISINKNDKYICIAPGKDIFEIRSWDNDKWTKICDFINDTYKIKILILGNNDDKINCENIYKNSRNTINLAGKLKLEETVHILKKAALLICVNGGLMHTAAALGTNVISLNGQSAYFWEAYGEKTISIRDKTLACIPCESFTCKYNGERKYMCMKNISVEIVKKNIIKVLEDEIKNK